jgi:hypothetical protein
VRENVEVCYGHQVFQQPKEEKLQKQDPLGFKISRKLKERYNSTIIKHTSQYSYNNPCEYFNHELFSIRGK